MFTGRLLCSNKALLFISVERILLKEDAQCRCEDKPFAWRVQGQSVQSATGGGGIENR